MNTNISLTATALSNMPQIKQAVTSAINQITLGKQSVAFALTGIAQINQEVSALAGNSPANANPQAQQPAANFVSHNSGGNIDIKV